MQVKGGHVQMLAVHIWITSNDPPYMWYKKGLQSLQRRLEEPLGRVEEMGMEGTVWQPPLPTAVSSLVDPPFSIAVPMEMQATEAATTASGSSMRYVTKERKGVRPRRG